MDRFGIRQKETYQSGMEKLWQLAWSPDPPRDMDVLFLIGWMFDHGVGFASRPKEGYGFYERAANQNHPMAIHNLGIFHVIGEDNGGGKPDVARAIEFFERSAAMGNAASMTELADIYMHPDNRLVAKDDTTILKMVQSAVEQGNPSALTFLGWLYEDGLIGCPQDPSKSFECYSSAAAKEYPHGFYQLGRCYHKGVGVEPNLRRAMDLYQRAADLGVTEAMVALGVVHDEGEGSCPQDHKKAFKLYEQAAALGDSTALMYLGNFYEFGWHDISPDPKRAHNYNWLAAVGEDADDGEEEAQQALAAAYLEGLVLPCDMARSAQFSKMAGDPIDYTGMTL